MISGHSYFRALCVHILSTQAITSVLMETSDARETVDTAMLEQIWDDLPNQKIVLKDALSTDVVLRITHFLQDELMKARQLGTTKLWIRHFDHIMTLLCFIRAERTRDWDLHLDSVPDILPTFHAAGHIAYVKSGQLFLQEMEYIEELLPAEDFVEYTFQGYFTIRRTNKFCIPMMEAIENQLGITSASSEQHLAQKDHKELQPGKGCFRP